MRVAIQDPVIAKTKCLNYRINGAWGEGRGAWLKGRGRERGRDGRKGRREGVYEKTTLRLLLWSRDEFRVKISMASTGYNEPCNHYRRKRVYK